eukprot:scaffold42659_cov62-Phaeocystis_antarctica.AAC.14
MINVHVRVRVGKRLSTDVSAHVRSVGDVAEEGDALIWRAHRIEHCNAAERLLVAIVDWHRVHRPVLVPRDIGRCLLQDLDQRLERSCAGVTFMFPHLVMDW